MWSQLMKRSMSQAKEKGTYILRPPIIEGKVRESIGGWKEKKL